MEGQQSALCQLFNNIMCRVFMGRHTRTLPVPTSLLFRAPERTEHVKDQITHSNMASNPRKLYQIVHYD